MALDPSIFTQLGIYDGPWNRPTGNVNGTTGNDDIQNGGVLNLLVNGYGGNDRVTITGGLASTVNGGDGSDQLYGGGGIDVLSGDAGNDYIDGGDGVDILSGGAGSDTLSYASFIGGGVRIDLSQPNVLGNIDVKVVNGQGQWVSNGDVVSNNFENIVGTHNDDTITGNEGNNILVGLDGNDHLFGRGGDDVLVAGRGDGELFGEAGNDTLVLGRIVLAQNTGDTLVANGGDGIDTLDLSGPENVRVFLDSGSGEVLGFPRSMTLIISGIENVIGSRSFDVIDGDSGNNVITGGGSFDLLTGGGGNDTFRYMTTTDSGNETGRDIIDDFGRGDKIDLQLIDANANVAGDQAFNFIGNTAFSGVAGQLHMNGQNLEGDVNGDGVADFAVQFDNGVPQAGDFIL